MRRHATPTRRPRRPLLVTADERLLDDLLRLAAAAGAEVEVAADPADARGRFSTAPLVMVGADQAPACLRARLPRRARVVIVGRSGEQTNPWAHAEALGAAYVALLPDAEPWLVERLADRFDGCPPAQVVAVQGARGGAGASVLAAGLATTAAQSGDRVLLVDADPLGGGLDLVLGCEDESGLRWAELADAGGRVDAPALMSALPRRGDLALLSFDRRDLDAVPPPAMAAVLHAGRAASDLVVVDLPRRLDPAAEVALQSADQCLLVVPAEIRAVTAATKMVTAISEHCPQINLVVRGPSPGRLTPDEIAAALGLPVVGTLRPETGLPAALEDGQGPGARGRGPLAVLCRRLVAGLRATAPAEETAA